MIESSVSVDAFLAFAVDGTLNGSTVKVIVDHNVEAISDEGEVRAYAYAVIVQKPIVFSKGDVLTIGSNSYELQDIIIDDDILLTIEAL